MGWLGTALGAYTGFHIGGILGGIIGAVVGNIIENSKSDYDLAREGGRTATSGRSSGGDYSKTRQSSDDTRRRSFKGGSGASELVVLAALAAMFAKLSKADGRVTSDEVRYCEQVFSRLGLTGEKRQYCVEVFRKAKDDSHTIYEYAVEFERYTAKNLRATVYDILWDLAMADGDLSSAEREMLKNLTKYLNIDGYAYYWQCSRRGFGYDGESAGTSGNGRRRTGGESSSATGRNMDPYQILECSRNATNDELKKAYRNKAKQLHPDHLRAQGLSEELLGRANEQMARLNAAWAQLRKERGM